MSNLMRRRSRWWRRKGEKQPGFRYFDADGVRIRDRERLERIQHLVIPPAWQDVLICPNPKGPIQAVGYDSLDRLQYLYHPSFTTKQSRLKFEKLERFGRALPQLRKQICDHIQIEELSREKVVAVVVRLIHDLYFRVGSERNVRRYRTFGITTLRNKHLRQTAEGDLYFRFVGKHHLTHERTLTDRELGAIVTGIRQLDGSRLFQYVDEQGTIRQIRPRDVNDYIKSAMGPDFTAKDFRIWAGTLNAAIALAELGPAKSQRQAKRNLVCSMSSVGALLGNTPAVVRGSYVHPAVIDLYTQGKTLADFRCKAERWIAERHPEYEIDEAALLMLLRGASKPRKRR